MERICSTCGVPLYDGERFCKICGVKVAPQALCANCGAPLGDKARFCKACGVQTTMASAVCQYCGRAIKPGETACSSCCAPVNAEPIVIIPASADAEVIVSDSMPESLPESACPRCGAQVRHGALYCKRCGASVKTPAFDPPKENIVKRDRKSVRSTSKDDYANAYTLRNIMPTPAALKNSKRKCEVLIGALFAVVVLLFIIVF